MYGMVNKAVRGFVLKNFNRATWKRIHTSAGVDENFISMQAYDDTVTYNLVAAAHDELGLSPSDILQGFGKYWVTDIALEHYGEMMAKSGAGFVDFVKNLDHLHERIRVTFPDYRPPSFKIKVLDDAEIELDYYSHREELLLDFVIGLLTGLAVYYGIEIDIFHVPGEEHPMPCQRMRIRMSTASEAIA